jgi:hypothetical protein
MLPVNAFSLSIHRKARIQTYSTHQEPEQEDDEDEQFVCFIQLSSRNVVYILRLLAAFVNSFP